jgi:cobalamin biosynthesis Mg chelatase CobN
MNFTKNRNIAPNIKPMNFLRIDTIVSPKNTDSSSNNTSGASSSESPNSSTASSTASSSVSSNSSSKSSSNKSSNSTSVKSTSSSESKSKKVIQIKKINPNANPNINPNVNNNVNPNVNNNVNPNVNNNVNPNVNTNVNPNVNTNVNTNVKQNVKQDIKTDATPVKKIEKFEFTLENFSNITHNTISNITVEKAVLIGCLIFSVVCAIIGFWYLIFGMTNNRKYYNYTPKVNSPMPQSMQQLLPVTSSVSKFMFR